MRPIVIVKIRINKINDISRTKVLARLVEYAARARGKNDTLKIYIYLLFYELFVFVY
jgi:hypothetical protein